MLPSASHTQMHDLSGASLLQQEIVDETDIFEDVNAGVRRRGQRVDVANMLAMFEHKLNHLQARDASLDTQPVSQSTEENCRCRMSL